MNFKEIIKQEWGKEYPLAEGQEPYNFEDSLFSIYHELVERICARVWNEAVDKCLEEVETKDIHGSGQYLSHMVVDEQSILKLKINETEV